MKTYRWIVRVEGNHVYAPYAREVTTDGPHPDQAIKAALERIAEAEDCDLWQRDALTVRVERVR